MSLNNIVCVVTGGTGSLGKEIVAGFLRDGARVIVNYRGETRFSELKEYCSNDSKLFGYPVHLDSEAQVNDFFRKIKSDFGSINVLLHVAGGFWMGEDIAETSTDKWYEMIKTNLQTTFLCVREAFALMKKSNGGRIFTVSAKAAVDLPAGMGAYAVSKAAVLALSQILANEGVPFDIQVNTILPSIIDTAANRKAMPEADFSQWVTPRAISDLLVRLCQPDAAEISHTPLKMYGKIL